MKFFKKALLVSIALFFFTNCHSLPIDSVWKNMDIKIDGNADEWNNVLQNIPDRPFGLGMENDDKFLYICISSWDRAINEQVIRNGLMLTFTTKSGKHSVFGIHFPVGMTREEIKEAMKENPDHEHGLMQDIFEKTLEKLEVLGPSPTDTLPMKLNQADACGLILRIQYSPKGNFVYEAKIPLREDSLNKFAIGVGKDTVIQMKCETSALAQKESEGEHNSEGGAPEGGMGGGGGGRGGMGHGGGGGRGGMGHGGGGGGGGGGHQQASSGDPFKAAFTITLAGKPK